MSRKKWEKLENFEGGYLIDSEEARMEDEFPHFRFFTGIVAAKRESATFVSGGL
jgi:hypothetical protein